MLHRDIPTDQNPADLATKVIPGGMKRNYLLGLLVYDIVGYHE